MGNLSEHFDKSEFKCECCGQYKDMSKLLIDRLEKLHSLMGAKAIYINSGYRCTKNPWGFPTDAHRKCIAADIRVQRKDGTFYTSEDIAEAAERGGFGGIGMMLPDSCHVDTRDTEPYTNDWWHGCETTNTDYPYKNHTFQRGTVFDGEKPAAQKNPLKVTLEFDDHQYSGLLEEM